ncbi:hypothetical protein HW555_012239 [Spodoptera exigua]|uniref:Uncharacterized protein n=1 Tax=Spodoptera exigua TaxID=7107 RepID=A0A835KZ87_SPOEX|nr:hypothetical protein HW555_012239 [Spodoptera exigua]
MNWALCSDANLVVQAVGRSSCDQSSLLRYIATMPINAETVNLAATYMILVILLFFLWLLYSTVF